MTRMTSIGISLTRLHAGRLVLRGYANSTGLLDLRIVIDLSGKLSKIGEMGADPGEIIRKYILARFIYQRGYVLAARSVGNEKSTMKVKISKL